MQDRYSFQNNDSFPPEVNNNARSSILTLIEENLAHPVYSTSRSQSLKHVLLIKSWFDVNNSLRFLKKKKKS